MGPARQIGGRLLHLLFVLWAVATILFLMFRLMPGNPLAAYIDPTFTEEQQRILIERFGLDRPLAEQYLVYLANLLQGDLGDSFRYRAPVGERILALLPNTLVLTFSSLILAYAVGILAGAWLAWRRGALVERAVIPVVLTTRALPEFWLGMVLLAIFSFQLGWLPAGGTRSPGAEYAGYLDLYTSRDFLAHLVLPVATLAIYSHGLPLLLMRSNMLDVMREDFVTMARIKGLGPWTVVIRHAARNALLPVVTSFALAVGYQIQGNVVVETVFSWPGLGRELVEAVSAADYPMAQGAFLLIAVVVVVMNGLADLLYGLLDPRVARGQ
jgi:peptide/nickel transport system permease protein